MKAVLFAVIAGSLALPITSPAQSNRGDQLADKCRAYLAVQDVSATRGLSPDQVAVMAMNAGYCAGFITGFIGGRSFGASPGSGLASCAPSDVTVDQYARVVILARERAPQLGNMPELPFLIGSIAGAWPCSAPE